MVEVKEEEEGKNVANGAVAAILCAMTVVKRMEMDRLPKAD